MTETLPEKYVVRCPFRCQQEIDLFEPRRLGIYGRQRSLLSTEGLEYGFECECGIHTRLRDIFDPAEMAEFLSALEKHRDKP